MNALTPNLARVIIIFIYSLPRDCSPGKRTQGFLPECDFQSHECAVRESNPAHIVFALRFPSEALEEIAHLKQEGDSKEP